MRRGESVVVPEGASAVWTVTDAAGENVLSRYDLALDGNVATFELGAGEGALPYGGEYKGWVEYLHGTNSLGVVDLFPVEVEWAPTDPGAEKVYPPSEYPPIVDAVQDFLDAAAGQVASNSAAIAARPTFDWVAAYVATNSSGGGVVGVDTNAIVASAVEAGRSEFYGLDSAAFGYSSQGVSFGNLADTAQFANDATRVWAFPNVKQASILENAEYFSVGYGAITSRYYATSITLGGETRTNWPSGGGGSAWQPTSRVITSATYTVSADDCLVWMDSETAATNQVLNLPDMTNESFTVVVRHLGNDFPTTIRRATATATNTYQLNGDGASVAVDWLGAKNTWYWRQAY